MRTKYTCCKKVGNWLTNTCGKTAKFERDGKHYCGIHDPVSVKEKQDKRDIEWRKQFDANNAALEKAFAARKEIERRADCYPELLEALQELADCGGDAWGEDRPCVQIARMAIAKALGEQA